MSKIFLMRQLKELILSIESAFCPHGCCRKPNSLFRFVHGFHLLQHVKIGVRGQQVAGENAMVVEAIKSIGHMAAYDLEDVNSGWVETTEESMGTGERSSLMIDRAGPALRL